MDNNNFWGNAEKNKDNEEKSLATPETYYHDINTPPADGEDRYYEFFNKDKPKTIVWSLASMILGIVSIVCSLFGWVGLIFGIAAVVLAIVSRLNLGYFDKMSVLGLIFGIFGIVFGAAIIIFDILVEKGKINSFIK